MDESEAQLMVGLRHHNHPKKLAIVPLQTLTGQIHVYPALQVVDVVSHIVH